MSSPDAECHGGGGGTVALGDLFEITGQAGGRIRFRGDLSRVNRLGAGLSEGAVVVEGNIGNEVGMGMSAGSIEVHGSAGDRAGGAAVEARRGMTGGELVIRGNAGSEAGSRMRRGMVAIGGDAGSHTGAGTIAGTIIVFGDAAHLLVSGPNADRSSRLARSPYHRPTGTRAPIVRQFSRFCSAGCGPATELPVEDRHVSGSYRRYSGDLADLGKGEILAWTA